MCRIDTHYNFRRPLQLHTHRHNVAIDCPQVIKWACLVTFHIRFLMDRRNCNILPRPASNFAYRPLAHSLQERA